MRKLKDYLFTKEDEGCYFVRRDQYFGIILSYVVMAGPRYMVYAIWEKYKDIPEWSYSIFGTRWSRDESFHKLSLFEELLLCPSRIPRIEATFIEREKIKNYEKYDLGQEQYKIYKEVLYKKIKDKKISKNECAILRSISRHDIKKIKKQISPKDFRQIKIGTNKNKCTFFWEHNDDS